jgi:hypothetical protein
MSVVLDESYVDQKVKIEYNDDKEAVEGKVEAASQKVILLKVKGKASAILIFPHEIKSAELLEQPGLQASTLKPVKGNTVKRHLLNFHGWTLSKVNDISEKEALVQHTGLHEGPGAADLGHTHKED